MPLLALVEISPDHIHEITRLDLGIIVAYFVAVILIGLWVSRRGAKDLDSYFLGGKSLKWYILGISDASGMFDISGTMWLVYILFVYGLKSCGCRGSGRCSTRFS